MKSFANQEPSLAVIDLHFAFEDIRSENVERALFIFDSECVLDGEVIKLIIDEINLTKSLKEINFVHPSAVIDFFLATIHMQIPSTVKVNSYRDKSVIEVKTGDDGTSKSVVGYYKSKAGTGHSA